MAGLGLLQLRDSLLTPGGGAGAAVGEAAERLGIDGAGNLALDEAVDLAGLNGIGLGDGGQQALGVGMQGAGVEVICVGKLHHAAQVHDQDAVGDVLDHRQVMGDKQIG